MTSCAASPPAEAPQAAPAAPSVSAASAAVPSSAAPAATAGAPDAEPVATAEPTSEAASAPSAPPPEPPKIRSPVDILTAPDVAFLIDERGSGLRAIFEVECDKSVKPDDTEAKARCVDKARDKFQPDVLRFRKDEQGKVTLSIYKRLGGTLKEAYVASVVFSEETPEGVKVAISGREQGQRPLFKSGNFVVRVPNDYSITLEDPKFGELSYDAKVGLVGAP